MIGGFVRGLTMRDVESLCEEAGLGKTSRSTVARICAELHERFEAFCRHSLYGIHLVVLFLDAIYLPVRPSGPKEGVVCAWGITEDGERALVSVRLGAREAKEVWVELGRDLISRGLAAPRLGVVDGAPGLIAAVEELWPRADRQHYAVHRLRNLLAKVPKSEHDRIRFNYWSALTDATSVKDGKLRLKVLIGELEQGGTSQPPAASQTTSTRSSCTCATRFGAANGGAQRMKVSRAAAAEFGRFSDDGSVAAVRRADRGRSRRSRPVVVRLVPVLGCESVVVRRSTSVGVTPVWAWRTNRSGAETSERRRVSRGPAASLGAPADSRSDRARPVGLSELSGRPLQRRQGGAGQRGIRLR